MITVKDAVTLTGIDMRDVTNGDYGKKADVIAALSKQDNYQNTQIILIDDNFNTACKLASTDAANTHISVIIATAASQGEAAGRGRVVRSS